MIVGVLKANRFLISVASQNDLNYCGLTLRPLSFVTVTVGVFRFVVDLNYHDFVNFKNFVISICSLI
jgi:hypothetical protein